MKSIIVMFFVLSSTSSLAESVQNSQGDSSRYDEKAQVYPLNESKYQPRYKKNDQQAVRGPSSGTTKNTYVKCLQVNKFREQLNKRRMKEGLPTVSFLECRKSGVPQFRSRYPSSLYKPEVIQQK